MNLCSIGEVAAVLGVAVGTLRRWHREGKLEPACRTAGNHRRYDLVSVKRALGLEVPEGGKTVCYARVSSHDQKEQLGWQGERLLKYCTEQGFLRVELISDLGSGLNYKKKGLSRLLLGILSGQVRRLVLVTKDRLLRFGAEIFFKICVFFNVEVRILDTTPDITKEQQLTEDLVEILTVFSSRLYGGRSRKNIRNLAAAGA